MGEREAAPGSTTVVASEENTATGDSSAGTAHHSGFPGPTNSGDSLRNNKHCDGSWRAGGAGRGEGSGRTDAPRGGHFQLREAC